MQVTDRPRPDAPSLTQTIIVQMVYYCGNETRRRTGEASGEGILPLQLGRSFGHRSDLRGDEVSCRPAAIDVEFYSARRAEAAKLRVSKYSPLQLRLFYGCGGSRSAVLFVDCAREIVHVHSSKVTRTQWWWYMFQVGSKSCPRPSFTSVSLDKEQKVREDVCLWELRAES